MTEAARETCAIPNHFNLQTYEPCLAPTTGKFLDGGDGR